jgi:putative ABC transport system permease protein
VQSAGRRAGPLSRAAILVGLLLSFGVSLGLFAATYDQQAAVDSQLSLGADVVVQAAPGSAVAAPTQRAASAVPGVVASSPVRHTFAYVGPDLQDMFAIDANSIGSSTTLRDSYVKGATMGDLLAGLRTQPDGVLVSAETLKDYGLNTGDLLRVRLFDERQGAFKVVPFHVLGVVSEFPMAPHDSFLVANLDYVVGATHARGPNVLFLSAPGDPHQVGAAVQAAVAASGAQVRDLTQEVALISSSLTAVDLAGISRLEEAYAVVLAAVAVTLFAGLTVIERRREFAIMAAMGAPLRTVGAFLWTEAAVILLTASVLSLILGGLLALMLVAILTHVFDPPPDSLALPWGFLAGLLGSALLGTLLAGWLAATGLRRLELGAVLREG